MFCNSKFSARQILLAGSAALGLASCAAGGGVVSVSDGVAVVSPGADWVVAQTTYLSSLTIPDGASVTAPEGESLTLTVDHVGTTLQPGNYRGNVVLTVTKAIPVKYLALPPHQFRVGIYVDNGAYVADKSVADAVVGGDVSDSAANGVSITSHEEKFNGILVTGNSHYTINNPRISFVGNGGNDFAGFGAAIMSAGNADVTVNNARINTYGAVRTAVFVGGHSNMTVNDSDIEVHSGTLPADYKFTLELGKMMEVPWMLGITGNVRATNLVDYGTVHYNNTHIKTDGWGALSVDAAAHTRLYATNCLIETTDSGYGAYTIGDSLDYFSHDTFNVASMALIMAAEGSATFTDGTVVNSRRFGVIAHSGSGGGTLTIENGSVFNTRSTAILFKGRGDHVIVDHAVLHPGNGILLETIVNDDPFAAPGGGPVVGVAGAATGTSSSDTDAVFRNTTLAGDIVNALTNAANMKVTLEDATITGAITTATAAPALGHAPTRADLATMGDVMNKFGATGGEFGLDVALDGTSKWVVTGTSYLSSLDLAPGAVVSAPRGERVVLLVNGARRALRAGDYAGKITLEVR